MEENPKSGLVKFKGEDRQHIYRESEVVCDLGAKGLTVFSLVIRARPSRCETEFFWLPDSLHFVTEKPGALCSEAQRVKYFVIDIIIKVYPVLFPVKQVTGKTK